MPAQESQGSQRISVAMIVRDEELALADGVLSARRLADEIVVLDTGSVDRTMEIARQHGARVVTTGWHNDFAAARNELLDHVAGDWILWLDAGERLEAPVAAALREFVANGADSSHVYSLMVRQASSGSEKSVEQAAKLRLMPNRPDLWFEGRVRESLKPAIVAAGMDVATAPGHILRHPRHVEPAERARRARRNRRLGALEAAGEGRARLRGWLAQGEAALELGDIPSARESLQHAIREAARGSSESLEAYYALLTTFDNDPAGEEQRLTVCLAALEQFPLDAQLLCAMGTYLQRQGRLELAARAYDAALKHGQIHAETWHLVDLGPTAARCLTIALQLLGRHEEAAAEVERALSRFPESAGLRRQYVELKIKLGQPEDAIRGSVELAAEPSQREPLRDAIRGACLAIARQWLPALGSLQAAYVAGCRDPICLKWLSITLMSNRQAALAVPVLEQWRQIEPESAEVQAYLDAMVAQREATPRQPASSQWLRIDGAAPLGKPVHGDTPASARTPNP